MKYTKIVVIAVIAGLLMTACEGQILNKEPKDSFTNNDIWQDINLAQNYLNSVYRGIGKWGISDNNPATMPSSATDQAMQRGDHGIWIFNRGNITASDLGNFNKWEPNYDNIRKCNIFLENIDKVPNADQDVVKIMKAQVRFIRAKSYADLINWYSWWEGEHNGVPIITKSFELGDDYAVERANYDDVVNFIVSELDAVAQVLPIEWSNDNWGRVTKGAALALKSEVLLYAASKRHNPQMNQEPWQKAADAAEAVINMNQYQLVQVDGWKGYAQIFLGKNPEIILARSFDPQITDNIWLDKLNSPNGFLGWAGNCPTQNMVDKFAMANGKMINEPGSGYDPQHPYKNRSLRFYANVVYNGRMYRGRKVEFFIPGGKDSKDGPQGWNTSPTSYTLYKFMDESIDFSLTNATTPYIMFRLAEIYLNYAEAQFHLGKENIAREYVNKIRRRAHMPEITSSGDQLLQDIRHERTMELAFENDHRWNDVRRWEILDETAGEDYIKMVIHKNEDGSLTYERAVAMERTFHAKMYSLPIPLAEIQRTSLKQNPGY